MAMSNCNPHGDQQLTVSIQRGGEGVDGATGHRWNTDGTSTEHQRNIDRTSTEQRRTWLAPGLAPPLVPGPPLVAAAATYQWFGCSVARGSNPKPTPMGAPRRPVYPRRNSPGPPTPSHSRPAPARSAPAIATHPPFKRKRQRQGEAAPARHQGGGALQLNQGEEAPAPRGGGPGTKGRRLRHTKGRPHYRNLHCQFISIKLLHSGPFG